VIESSLTIGFIELVKVVNDFLEVFWLEDDAMVIVIHEGRGVDGGWLIRNRRKTSIR
jgi:hypothetical protein